MDNLPKMEVITDGGKEQRLIDHYQIGIQGIGRYLPVPKLFKNEEMVQDIEGNIYIMKGCNS